LLWTPSSRWRWLVRFVLPFEEKEEKEGKEGERKRKGRKRKKYKQTEIALLIDLKRHQRISPARGGKKEKREEGSSSR